MSVNLCQCCSFTYTIYCLQTCSSHEYSKALLTYIS
jgi:hypothetical protein